MKKILLALSLSAPCFSYAQAPDLIHDEIKSIGQHYRWEIGVNGGLNLSNARGLDSLSSISNMGKLYGITVVYHVNRFVGIKTDLDYETKGWTIQGVDLGGANGIRNVRQNLNYFDVPAFLHLGFGNRMMFDLNFGPYIGFLLSEGASFTDASGQVVKLTDEAYTGFSKFDWGMVYGAGIDFALTNRLSFGFDFLYEQGMKVIKGDDLKNSAMIFDFGLNFMLGRKNK
jgi:opacity protein-like surface antigen